jgi:hypothetical protein
MKKEKKHVIKLKNIGFKQNVLKYLPVRIILIHICY